MVFRSFAEVERIIRAGWSEDSCDPIDLDLTREQFLDGEVIQAPQVIERASDLTTGRLYPQYVALRSRALGSAEHR